MNGFGTAADGVLPAATCIQDFMNLLRSSSTKPRGGKQKRKMGLIVRGPPIPLAANHILSRLHSCPHVGLTMDS